MTTTKDDVQPTSAQSDAKTDACKPENDFYCEICKIACLMASIYEAHCQGEKHKRLKVMMHGEDGPKKGQKIEELPGDDPKKDQKNEELQGDDPKKDQKNEELQGDDHRKGQKIEEIKGDDPRKGQKIEELKGDDYQKGQKIEKLQGDDPQNEQKAEELQGHSQTTDFRKHARFLKIYAYTSSREPLIGLQHVIENTVPDSSEPRFTCDLCEYCSKLGPLIEHLNSFEHRKAYIAKQYPYLLKAPPAQNEDRVAFLKRMALDVERDEGVKMYRSEILQDDALHFLKTFDIDSDEEALSVMTITQNLSETLKTYCLQKANSEKVGNTANISDRVNSLNLPLADASGRGNAQMSLEPQSTPWNRQAKSVDLGQEVAFHNQLSQPMLRPAGIDNCSPQMVQNFQAMSSLPIKSSEFSFSLNRPGDAMSYKPTGNQINSYGRMSNDSELRPFAPNEPRGHGDFPSESLASRNKYNLSDRGPLPGGPSAHSISDRVPEYQAYRNSPLIPSPNIGRSGSWNQDPEHIYLRDQDHGSRFRTTSGTFSDNLSSSYTSGASNTRIIPDTLDPQQRSKNLGFPKYLQTNLVVPPHADPLRTSFARDVYRGLPRTMADAGRRELWERDSLYNKDFPKLASLDPLVNRSTEMYSAGIGNRTFTGNSFSSAPAHTSNLPRSSMPDMPVVGATSGLAADIVALIKGKDVKVASQILTEIAPTHPALKKVNIGNLLNLLVQTGTIH